MALVEPQPLGHSSLKHFKKKNIHSSHVTLSTSRIAQSIITGRTIGNKMRSVAPYNLTVTREEERNWAPSEGRVGEVRRRLSSTNKVFWYHRNGVRAGVGISALCLVILLSGTGGG